MNKKENRIFVLFLLFSVFFVTNIEIVKALTKEDGSPEDGLYLKYEVFWESESDSANYEIELNYTLITEDLYNVSVTSNTSGVGGYVLNKTSLKMNVPNMVWGQSNIWNPINDTYDPFIIKNTHNAFDTVNVSVADIGDKEFLLISDSEMKNQTLYCNGSDQIFEFTCYLMVNEDDSLGGHSYYHNSTGILLESTFEYFDPNSFEICHITFTLIESNKIDDMVKIEDEESFVNEDNIGNVDDEDNSSTVLLTDINFPIDDLDLTYLVEKTNDLGTNISILNLFYIEYNTTTFIVGVNGTDGVYLLNDMSYLMTSCMGIWNYQNDSHTPFFIDPNCSEGDSIPISSGTMGDVEFNVEDIYYSMSFILEDTSFDCCCLKLINDDPNGGGTLYYHKSTGLLLHGSFTYIDPNTSERIELTYTLLDSNGNDIIYELNDCSEENTDDDPKDIGINGFNLIYISSFTLISMVSLVYSAKLKRK